MFEQRKIQNLLMFFSVLALSCFAGFAQGGRSADDPDAAMSEMSEESAQIQYEKITCDDLKKLIDTKATSDIVIVDLSPKDIYDDGHIPGAVSYPWVSQIKPPLSLPRNKTLILYCPCVAEEDSTDMANKLRMFGYSKMKLLLGGSLKWDELKYPMVKSKAK